MYIVHKNDYRTKDFGFDFTFYLAFSFFTILEERLSNNKKEKNKLILNCNYNLYIT